MPVSPRPLLFTALLLGCRPAPASTPPAPTRAASAETSDEPGADDGDEPETTYVMLWDGATLASGFDSSADTARAYDTLPAGPATSRFWILRVVAEHGEFYEVQTTEDPRAHPHCVLPLTALDDYALRLYVRKDEVSTVTRREVTVTLPGGDRVTLGPGVRVTPPRRPDEPAQVDVTPPLLLVLPPDAIGQRYLAPRHYDEGPSVGSLHLDALRLDGTIELPRHLGESIYARRDEGEHAVVTLAKGCVRYEVRVPADAIEDPLAYGIGGGGGSGRSTPRYTIAADAPIWWTNGEPAGTTRRRVERYDEPQRTEPGRICFGHLLSSNKGSEDPLLTLCFDSVDVQPVEAPAPPGSAPSG